MAQNNEFLAERFRDHALGEGGWDPDALDAQLREYYGQIYSTEEGEVPVFGLENIFQTGPEIDYKRFKNNYTSQSHKFKQQEDRPRRAAAETSSGKKTTHVCHHHLISLPIDLPFSLRF